MYKWKFLTVPIAAVLLIYWTYSSFFLTKESDGKRRIRLAENASPLSALTIVARKKGFFADEGINVEVAKFTSGKLALDALLGGGADIATVAETPLMFAGFSGQDFDIFATIFRSENACKVVARKDKGINGLIDLKGKKVATFAGTNAEYFMSEILKTVGLSSSDMEVLNLQPTEMVVALKQGDIDAYFVWEPHVFNGKSLVGDNAIVFESPGIYITTFNIVAKPKYLATNQATVSSFVRALVKSQSFIRDHPDEAKQIVADQTGIPFDTLKTIWKEYEFPIELEQSLLGFLEKQAKWALDTGRVRGTVPSYNKHMNKQILEKVEERKSEL
jgi:aliphatic sulfonates family ABC transporter substrate-binding protein